MFLSTIDTVTLIQCAQFWAIRFSVEQQNTGRAVVNLVGVAGQGVESLVPFNRWYFILLVQV